MNPPESKRPLRLAGGAGSLNMMNLFLLRGWVRVWVNVIIHEFRTAFNQVGVLGD